MFHVPAHKSLVQCQVSVSIGAALRTAIRTEAAPRLFSVHALHCAAAGVAPCVRSPVLHVPPHKVCKS